MESEPFCWEKLGGANQDVYKLSKDEFSRYTRPHIHKQLEQPLLGTLDKNDNNTLWCCENILTSIGGLYFVTGCSLHQGSGSVSKFSFSGQAPRAASARQCKVRARSSQTLSDTRNEWELGKVSAPSSGSEGNHGI